MAARGAASEPPRAALLPPAAPTTPSPASAHPTRTPDTSPSLGKWGTCPLFTLLASSQTGGVAFRISRILWWSCRHHTGASHYT
ncbi:hypothetical protein CEXT_123051 [Caerostris extrusa]|uniref:Uncharacterized protein n=1 Tax=Caerostris extrusa TaxID=172846 RepID=A0AAV4SVK2_CAEEX|nr:hypothetical protein CEXT_123051 [Caerostris extrusa]